ncbi:hypothetical protein YC2023_082608 [Brassica napus]
MRRLPDKVKPIQIKQMNNLTMRQDTREPMNEITKETPDSPIAQQNIETPVLTPIQTQQPLYVFMKPFLNSGDSRAYE